MEEDVASPVQLLQAPSIHNTFWERHRSAEPTHAFIHKQPMYFGVSGWSH
jgi:hypothetical protein